MENGKAKTRKMANVQLEKRIAELIQNLYHDFDEEQDFDVFLDETSQLIGLVILFFNSLEKSLDNVICEGFSDRTEEIGLLVIHQMSYSSKVELFARLSSSYISDCGFEIPSFEGLIDHLKESARLRNMVVHSDWNNIDSEGYTFHRVSISNGRFNQEYLQFTPNSLMQIVDQITRSKELLSQFWEDRMDSLRDPSKYYVENKK